MILVIGSGFLGSYLLKNARTYYPNEPIIGTYRNEANVPALSGVDFVQCDVAEPDDIRALSEACAGEKLTVFYTAACHNIDYIVQNQTASAVINIACLENFYALMPKIDKLFFTSTDCVYGENPATGQKLAETDELHPVNVYGFQKAAAEKIVLSHGHCVVRLPFMFGPSLSAKKSFYDTVCERLRSGEKVEMIDGMIRSALTYEKTADLLLRLSALEKEDIPPILNVCSDTAHTKYDVGVRIAAEIGAPETLIKKITEQEGQKFFIDARASSSVMDNRLLKETLHLKNVD